MEGIENKNRKDYKACQKDKKKMNRSEKQV